MASSAVLIPVDEITQPTSGFITAYEAHVMTIKVRNQQNIETQRKIKLVIGMFEKEITKEINIGSSSAKLNVEEYAIDVITAHFESLFYNVEKLINGVVVIRW